mgnify:CR=1 FL=1
MSSDTLRSARRIVVKVGSSLVTNEGRGLDETAIGEWCRQLAALARDGREVIMVSSGAIAEGMKRLGWPTRPREINELQEELKRLNPVQSAGVLTIQTTRGVSRVAQRADQALRHAFSGAWRPSPHAKGVPESPSAQG